MPTIFSLLEAFYFARQQLLMIVALTACNTIFCRWLLTSLQVMALATTTSTRKGTSICCGSAANLNLQLGFSCSLRSWAENRFQIQA